MTQVSAALAGARRLGIDSAPLIYFIGKHPAFGSTVRAVIEQAERGEFLLVGRLRAPDASQLAVAQQAGCEAFLTNDSRLSRV